jgi:hypothetical protein
MNEPKDGDLYFFVDEAGDATFYNRKGRLIVGTEGCSQHLILGFIRIKNDPAEIRQRVLALHREVINDPYFQQLPSFVDTSIAFHANKDAPEVRYLLFRLIQDLNFKACFVVSFKDEQLFNERFHRRTNEYYDHMVSQLFQNSLHRYTRNYVTIAARGSRSRQEPLETAVEHARLRFEKRHSVGRAKTDVIVSVQSPKGEPCLAVIDYVAWAIQRCYTSGDMKYYSLIQDKVSVIHELKVGAKPIIYKRRHRLQRR